MSRRAIARAQISWMVSASLVVALALASCAVFEPKAARTQEAARSTLGAKGARLDRDAFLAAVLSGNAELVRLYIQAGMDFEFRSSDRGSRNLTPLHWAIWTGNNQVAEILLEYGADPTAVATSPATTALHMAIGRGAKAVALTIIDKIKDVDLRDGAGRTPLFVSARDELIDVTRALLAKGSNANARDVVGWTPLIYALRNGQREIAKLLLESGASVDDEIQPPLILAAGLGDLQLVQTIVAHGAHPSTQAKGGDTALAAAARGRHIVVAQYLIERGADVNKGEPLLAAAFHGQIDMVKLLLDSGANVNAVDENGRSAMILATDDDRLEVMRLLISRGANVNTSTRHGETPLLFAARRGQEESLELLLRHGADTKAVNRAGKTASDYSEQYPNIGAILRRYERTRTN